jgi:hypothetical protein
MTESEIWCTAASMLKQHGHQAAMEAAMMADKLHARKDSSGYEVWNHITLAIRELQEGRRHAS